MAAAAFALASSALAQMGSLPDDLITATSVASRQGEIERFVEPKLEELASTDPSVRQSARDALLQPLLGSPEPSRAFRIGYGSSMGDELLALVDHSNVGVALAALRISGALASEQGYRAIQRGMADDRNAVRYAAVAAMGELFRIASRNEAALPGRLLEEALQAAQRALESEPEPLVADRIIQSLAEPEFGSELRPRTLLVAARAAADQFRSWREKDQDDPETLAAAARAITTVRSELIRLLGQGATDRSFAAAAGVLGGHALSYALDVQSRAGWPTGGSAMLPAIADSAEGVIALAEQTRGREPFDPNLVRDRTGIRRDGLMEWIGPRGALTSPPYGESSERFLAGLDGR